MSRRWLLSAFTLVTAALLGCGSNGAAPDVESPTATVQQRFSDSLDFTLISTNGGAVSFADLRGVMPVSLFFYDTATCEDCEERLSDFQAAYPRFRDVGFELLAISTDPPEKARSTAEALGLEFPVLTDVDEMVSNRWGVLREGPSGESRPALVLLDGAGNEIARQQTALASDLPGVDELLQTMQRAIDSSLAGATPTPGTNNSQAGEPGLVSLGFGATDFLLPDAINGEQVSLSETIQDRAVVLVFYRAFW